MRRLRFIGLDPHRTAAAADSQLWPGVVGMLVERARQRGWSVEFTPCELDPARGASGADAMARPALRSLDVHTRGWPSARAAGRRGIVLLPARGRRAPLAPGPAAGEFAVLEIDRDPSEVVRDFEFLLGDEAWLEPGGLVGSSIAMRRLRADLARAARCRATLLLSGATGTGKTAAARALHQLGSDRGAAATPFVQLDCAALSPALLESELFGHERGAFTGAVARRIGRFEAAGEGTILLDEIGELASPLQAKFLRVLEEREFERVGGSRSIAMRARVVAATNVTLAEAVASGRFRSDLLYRLEVLAIEVPSLAARPEDIPELARAGLARAAQRLAVSPPALPRALAARLMQRPWPGNVRQLFNLLERMLVAGGGELVDDLLLAELDARAPCGQPGPTQPAPGHPFGLEGEPALDAGSLAAPEPIRLARSVPAAAASAAVGERTRVAEALVASGGNIARAARRLGIPRSTAQYRIARLGLRHLIPPD